MCDLISHPGILLYDHLQNVGMRAASILLQLKPNLHLNNIPSDELARAAFITGICHDFGKAKLQYQDYIKGGKKKEKEHAAISSIFAFLVAANIFGDKPQPIRLLPFVCAYAINRHHGVLRNLEEAFNEADLDNQIFVAKGNLDERVWAFQFKHEQLGISVDFADYRKKFEGISAKEITEQINKFSKLLRQKSEEKAGWLIDLYFALLLIISSLTESDVGCVLGAPEPNPCHIIDPEPVLSFAFRQRPAPESFQELRRKAWQEIRNVLGLEETALRLTLPTGLGKTLMGLYLCGQMQQRKAMPNPVIYALPYLSLIEQATEVARSVFQNKDVSVIQHHSLSFPVMNESESPNFEQARFSLEDWNADLIITTFDQLFYSFLSSERSFIHRFFRLPGSVILLDEVQTIPPRLLPAVEMLLQELRHKMNVHIIYMTATHPPFLQNIASAVDNEASYFKPLRRTRLNLQLEPMLFSNYLSQIDDWLIQRRGKKVLLVTNTIRCAQTLFRHLNELKKESAFKELQIFQLSGAVVPIERLRRILRIKELVQNDPEAWIAVVSTQCVEAGVDLDMDEAVRDFAPWDSLLQVCGRVNRFGKRPCADVWVYRWVDDSGDGGREFHSYIYDSVFTDATLAVLQNRTVINESDYWLIQRTYAQELEQRLSKKQSDELLIHALSWQFDELEFQKLFRGQERAWKVSVFCVADDTAEKLKKVAIELWSSKNPKGALEILETLCNMPNLFQPLKDFLRIKSDIIKSIIESLRDTPEYRLRFALSRLLQPMLQAYTISIPVRKLDELPFRYITEGFPYLPQDVYAAINGDAGKDIGFPDYIL